MKRSIATTLIFMLVATLLAVPVYGVDQTGGTSSASEADKSTTVNSASEVDKSAAEADKSTTVNSASEVDKSAAEADQSTTVNPTSEVDKSASEVDNSASKGDPSMEPNSTAEVDKSTSEGDQTTSEIDKSKVLDMMYLDEKALEAVKKEAGMNVEVYPAWTLNTIFGTSDEIGFGTADNNKLFLIKVYAGVFDKYKNITLILANKDFAGAYEATLEPEQNQEKIGDYYTFCFENTGSDWTIYLYEAQDINGKTLTSRAVQGLPKETVREALKTSPYSSNQTTLASEPERQKAIEWMERLVMDLENGQIALYADKNYDMKQLKAAIDLLKNNELDWSAGTPEPIQTVGSLQGENPAVSSFSYVPRDPLSPGENCHCQTSCYVYNCPNPGCQRCNYCGRKLLCPVCPKCEKCGGVIGFPEEGNKMEVEPAID